MATYDLNYTLLKNIILWAFTRIDFQNLMEISRVISNLISISIQNTIQFDLYKAVIIVYYF